MLLDGKDWAEFGHVPSKKWTFNQVAKEIAEQTIRLAGSNKGIVDEAIKVSIYSPTVIPLTIVDLPGMVKVGFVKIVLDDIIQSRCSLSTHFCL